MITANDYELIASCLNNLKPDKVARELNLMCGDDYLSAMWRATVRMFLTKLSQGNPKFNKRRFLKALGVTQEEVMN